MLIKKFFCPTNDWDCPYWKKDGSCSMVDEGDDPVMECDDAYSMWCDEDDEDFGVWDDYFVWEDENGNRYDAQELLEKGYHFVNDEPMMPPFEMLAEYEYEMRHAPRYVNNGEGAK